MSFKKLQMWSISATTQVDQNYGLLQLIGTFEIPKKL
jgi:hypothetical protein